MSTLLAAAVLLPTACDSSTSGQLVPTSGSTASSTVVTVPLPAGMTPSITRSADVGVGGELDVTYNHNDSPGYWKLTAGGTAATLRQLPEIVTGCASQAPGCSTQHRARFHALARGTATVVWSFVGLGPGVPSADRTVVTITVTVT